MNESALKASLEKPLLESLRLQTVQSGDKTVLIPVRAQIMRGDEVTKLIASGGRIAPTGVP